MPLLNYSTQIVATQMVTLDQVMLPYLRTEDGGTLYDRYASRQLALGSGSGEVQPNA